MVQNAAANGNDVSLLKTRAQQVGIRPEYLDRLPHTFFRRAAPAYCYRPRSSSDPDIIVLMSPPALDISVQAQILIYW